VTCKIRRKFYFIVKLISAYVHTVLYTYMSNKIRSCVNHSSDIIILRAWRFCVVFITVNLMCVNIFVSEIDRFCCLQILCSSK
jgi:hypothetical protein